MEIYCRPLRLIYYSYTAGRDGVICSWNIGVDLTERTTESAFVPRPTPPPPSKFRAQIQAHTHWVNDIALCQSNTALVSASSDLTVKLWRPHAEQQSAETIGVHSDYVKCLATPGVHSDWVASGGLDRKIKLWDLNGGGEKLQIDIGDELNTKGSVYSLGIGGAGGGILASGGPESVVRVWDPRSGKRITKFLGHTDNVRAILVNEQGNIILTASSDTTIKMWSLTAGRCLHTLSMHSDSVWSLYSSHPALEIFHSSDRSGLVAKTDVRTPEIEEGICVAVCQEQESVNKVVASGDYLWTATQSSSINRWVDVDTNNEIATDAKRPRLTSSASVRPRPLSPASSPVIPSSPTTKKPTIPVSALLRISSTSSFPTNVRDPDAVTVYSITQAASIAETIDGDPGILVPANDLPDETIEGQHGLINHFLLNDRRRVLTLDTAGEVMMWDLLKCVPVKSFGKRHLDDVAAEINTVESVANWCQVDTRTGRLSCVLEENYCFDAELYADEADIESAGDFRDDQRSKNIPCIPSRTDTPHADQYLVVNLGKWVLRYLFNNLIMEEIRRDEIYRKKLEAEKAEREKLRRANAPPAISMPPPTFSMIDAASPQSPSSATTPKPISSFSLFPQTPGMSIGLATPAPAYLPSFTGDANTLPPTAEEEEPKNRGSLSPLTRSSMDRGDYFSSGNSAKPEKEKSGPSLGEACGDDTPLTPTGEKDKDEKDMSLLGRWKSFGNRKLGRSMSADITNKPPATVEEAPADLGGLLEHNPLDDTLAGVIKRLRITYDQVMPPSDGGPFRSGINPSLPSETPILKPPENTTILVQDDSPDSGGVADLYRGTVATVGEDADLLERVAPAWLGELILRNQIPLKEIVKVSFVLVPYSDRLPTLQSDGVAEGKNSRLNANRMLRAKKIAAYVAERLQPPFMQLSYVPITKEGEEGPKPEDSIELVCHDHVWFLLVSRTDSPRTNSPV